jgi:hypothetical protein
MIIQPRLVGAVGSVALLALIGGTTSFSLVLVLVTIWGLMFATALAAS